MQAWLWILIILLVPGLGMHLSLGHISPIWSPESFNYYSGLTKHDLHTDFDDVTSHSVGAPPAMSYTTPYPNLSGPDHGQPELTCPVQMEEPRSQTPSFEPKSSMFHQSTSQQALGYKAPGRTGSRLEFLQDKHTIPWPNSLDNQLLHRDGLHMPHHDQSELTQPVQMGESSTPHSGFELQPNMFVQSCGGDLQYQDPGSTFRKLFETYSQLLHNEQPHVSHFPTTLRSASPENQFEAGFPSVNQEITPSHFHQAGDSSSSPIFNNNDASAVANFAQADYDHHHSNNYNHQLPQSNYPALERNSHHQDFSEIIEQSVASNHQNPAVLVTQFDPARIFPNFQHLFKFKSKLKYYVIDFEPSSIDGILVMEAVNSLYFKDGTKFLSLDTSEIETQEPVKKMFCLSRDTDNIHTFFRFFTAVYHKYHVAPPYKSSHRSRDRKTVRMHTEFRTRLIEVALTNSIRRSGSNPGIESTILSYKKYVLEDLQETEKFFSKLIKRKISRICSQDPKLHEETLQFFDVAKGVFPLYLIYVDMISALIPMSTLDNEGQLLKGQREVAATYFFKAVTDQIFKYTSESQSKHQSKSPFDRVRRNKKNFSSNKTAFSWKALQNWILHSRPEIIDEKEQSLSNNMKQFFNYLVFCLVNKHPSHAN